MFSCGKLRLYRLLLCRGDGFLLNFILSTLQRELFANLILIQNTDHERKQVFHGFFLAAIFIFRRYCAEAVQGATGNNNQRVAS